jgi:hypothetical protein
MSRRRRGLFEIDTGEHSPELTGFLRRWLKPGHTPGQGGLGHRRIVERGSPADDRTRYNNLARSLWFWGVSVSAVSLLAVWLGQRFDTQMIAFLALAIVAAVLGVFAWRAGR